jgi:hypothetical protein
MKSSHQFFPCNRIVLPVIPRAAGNRPCRRIARAAAGLKQQAAGSKIHPLFSIAAETVRATEKQIYKKSAT